jgi:hypothetical protein
VIAVVTIGGSDATRWCPVHGQCLCGELHDDLTLTALWCFQSALAVEAQLPLGGAGELVRRWSDAHSRDSTTRIFCAGCTVYPALTALRFSPESLGLAFEREVLLGQCLAASPSDWATCREPASLPAFVRGFGDLDRIVAGDERFRCESERVPRGHVTRRSA